MSSHASSSASEAEDDLVTPVGKKRQRATPKPRAPKSIVGVSNAAWAKLSNVKELKKDMKGQVKRVSDMVNADWHDGYEEQGQAAIAFFHNFKPILEAVLEVSRASNAPAGAYERGNEALFILADAERDINAIPFRCPPSEAWSCNELEIEWKEGDVRHSMKFSSPGDAVAWGWRVLLRSAAGGGDRISDELLLRYLRDASDYGSASGLLDDDEHSVEQGSQIPGGEAGRERLKALIDGKRFEELKSRAKKYKMRRVIDRRYDGPKHLRTRDFGSDSEGDFGSAMFMGLMFGFGGRKKGGAGKAAGRKKGGKAAGVGPKKGGPGKLSGR
eukprot:tig00000254_g22513.t1